MEVLQLCNPSIHARHDVPKLGVIKKFDRFPRTARVTKHDDVTDTENIDKINNGIFPQRQVNPEVNGEATHTAYTLLSPNTQHQITGQIWE
jgi:hypothetical protein